jgi:hypothetical protein
MMPETYYKRSSTIEAIMFDGTAENIEKLKTWTGDRFSVNITEEITKDYTTIFTAAYLRSATDKHIAVPLNSMIVKAGRDYFTIVDKTDFDLIYAPLLVEQVLFTTIGNTFGQCSTLPDTVITDAVIIGSGGGGQGGAVCPNSPEDIGFSASIPISSDAKSILITMGSGGSGGSASGGGTTFGTLTATPVASSPDNKSNECVFSRQWNDLTSLVKLIAKK